MNNTKIIELNNYKQNNNIPARLPSVSAVFEKREVEKGKEGTSIIDLLFKYDYTGIGSRLLKDLLSRDIRNLREVCSVMPSMLFRKQAFNLRLTHDRLKDIDQTMYPRLYPKVEDSCHLTFEALPVDLVIRDISDLQAVLKDVRFVVKSVIFTGKLEDLQTVCESLPQSTETVEIGIEIPSNETVDLSQYERLKIVKVKNCQFGLLLPANVTILLNGSEEHPDIAALYNGNGKILKNQGKHTEALDYHYKALAIYQKFYGEESTYVAKCYDKIKNVLKAEGKYEEYIKYLTIASDIHKKVLSKKRPPSFQNDHLVPYTRPKKEEFWSISL